MDAQAISSARPPRADQGAEPRDHSGRGAPGLSPRLGFCHATVRDIIRATPLASGTFYNYFKSKEEVYQALRDDEEALAVRPAAARRRAARNTSAKHFLGAKLSRLLPVRGAKTSGASAGDRSRFRMDSPEVLAGFAELREDIEAAMARGLLPAADAAPLTAALTGGGVRAGRNRSRRARMWRTVTRFRHRSASGRHWRAACRQILSCSWWRALRPARCCR